MLPSSACVSCSCQPAASAGSVWPRMCAGQLRSDFEFKQASRAVRERVCEQSTERSGSKQTINSSGSSHAAGSKCPA